MSRPVLIACSHGTRDPAGRAAIHALIDGTRLARAELDVREAFVDVQEPEVADVVNEALGDGPDARAVVVPLLLSGGYHVHVDIARAVGAHPGLAVAAPALGPDARVVDVLARRLVEAGAAPGDAVVVAAAGSSDARASADVRAVAAALAEIHLGPVSVGYGSAAQPTVPDAVAAARVAGTPRVIVASYLLAPGYFHDRLGEAGADLVTAPLAPDRLLVDVVLQRYSAAADRLGSATEAR